MSEGFEVEGAVALVTGANRGLGAARVRGLLDAALAHDPRGLERQLAAPLRPA